MTIQEALNTIVNYPVPAPVIENIAGARTLALNDTASPTVLNSDSYRLATADILDWTSFAPNIQEGGVNINLLVTDRERMRERANEIYLALNDPKQRPLIKQTFSYTGDEV